MSEIVRFNNDREGFETFNTDLKYWSNAIGELHKWGMYDVTEENLPGQLRDLYRNVWEEMPHGLLCYLSEYQGKYGIALIAEYHEVNDYDMPENVNNYDRAEQVAEQLTELYPQHQVLLAKQMGFPNAAKTLDCASELIVFLEHGTFDKKEFDDVAKQFGEMAYGQEEPSLHRRILNKNLNAELKKRFGILAQNKYNLIELKGDHVTFRNELVLTEIRVPIREYSVDGVLNVLHSYYKNIDKKEKRTKEQYCRERNIPLDKLDEKEWDDLWDVYKVQVEYFDKKLQKYANEKIPSMEDLAQRFDDLRYEYNSRNYVDVYDSREDGLKNARELLTCGNRKLLGLAYQFLGECANVPDMKEQAETLIQDIYNYSVDPRSEFALEEEKERHGHRVSAGRDPVSKTR